MTSAPIVEGSCFLRSEKENGVLPGASEPAPNMSDTFGSLDGLPSRRKIFFLLLLLLPSLERPFLPLSLLLFEEDEEADRARSGFARGLVTVPASGTGAVNGSKVHSLMRQVCSPASPGKR